MVVNKGLIGLMSASALVAGVVVPVGDVGVEAVEPTSEGDFEFDNSTGEITGYLGSSLDVVIPGYIGDVAVTRIGDSAFSNKNLSSIVIPGSVTSIGDYAFRGNNLSNLDVPSSVTSIGEQAFYRNQLSSVGLKEGLESIGKFAFSENKISSIIIPGSVKSIGQGAFTKNEISSVKISEGISSIGDYVFASNKLNSVIIPGSVTSIGDYAFQGNELFSVNIPEGVTSIGDYAFQGNEIRNLKIPESVTYIGMSAFMENGIKNIIIPVNVGSIGATAFYENPIERVDVLGTPIIGNGAFHPSLEQEAVEAVPIYGIEGSTVEDYAKKWEHPFNPVDLNGSEGNGNRQSQDVTVNFKGGDLQLNIPSNVDFGIHQLTGDIKEVTRPLGGLQVIDARGTGEGWSLSVVASPLTMVDSGNAGFKGHTLKEGTLLISSTTAEQSTGVTDNLPTIDHVTAGVVDGDSVRLSTAAVGSGKGITNYNFEEYGLKLIIDPTDIEVDSTLGEGEATKYESTIEWSLVSGV